MNGQRDALVNQRLEEIYSSTWKNRLFGFFQRKYGEFADAQGWFEEAHQNLAARIAALDTSVEMHDGLIFALFKNEITAIKRQRYGHVRPRKWLKEFSELGDVLFEWLCLKKFDERTIVENARQHIKSRSPADEPGESLAELETLVKKTISMMVEKKECDGLRPMDTSSADGEIDNLKSDTPSVEEDATNNELKTVFELLMGPSADWEQVESKANTSLRKLRDKVSANNILSDSDRIILRCYYFQGMSQNEIAKAMQKPLHQIVRRRERLMKELKALFEDCGFSVESWL